MYGVFVVKRRFGTAVVGSREPIGEASGVDEKALEETYSDGEGGSVYGRRKGPSQVVRSILEEHAGTGVQVEADE